MVYQVHVRVMACACVRGMSVHQDLVDLGHGPLSVFGVRDSQKGSAQGHVSVQPALRPLGLFPKPPLQTTTAATRDRGASAGAAGSEQHGAALARRPRRAITGHAANHARHEGCARGWWLVRDGADKDSCLLEHVLLGVRVAQEGRVRQLGVAASALAMKCPHSPALP